MAEKDDRFVLVMDVTGKTATRTPPMVEMRVERRLHRSDLHMKREYEAE
jgi:hypothetical protein